MTKAVFNVKRTVGILLVLCYKHKWITTTQDVEESRFHSSQMPNQTKNGAKNGNKDGDMDGDKDEDMDARKF